MIDTLDVLKRGSLKYLVFTIQENEEINEDGVHHIEVGWMKWRLVFDVMCVKKVNRDLKVSSINLVVARLTILFEIECWSIKNSHFKKMKLVEIDEDTYIMSV